MLVSAKDDTSRVGVVAVNLLTATLKLKTIFNTVLSHQDQALSGWLSPVLMALRNLLFKK